MIENGLLSIVFADRQISDGELERIRENGEGNGFTALDTADGFRRDGSLWFGTCSVCGEQVTNSWSDGVWKHRVVTEEARHAYGSVSHSASYQVDFCPTGVK